jgi:hypothetical protein
MRTIQQLIDRKAMQEFLRFCMQFTEVPAIETICEVLPTDPAQRIKTKEGLRRMHAVMELTRRGLLPGPVRNKRYTPMARNKNLNPKH